MLPSKSISSLFIFVFIIIFSSAATGKPSRNYCDLMRSLGAPLAECSASITAPALSTSKTTVSKNRKRLLHTISFMKNTLISSLARERFDIFARNMNKSGHYEIVGHASKRGAAQLNNEISINRAEFIKNILINEYGFRDDQLLAKGVGFNQPLYGINPAAITQQRVEIYQIQ